MRAVIYARISRAPVGFDETSTPRQIANCRAFLAAKGWTEHGVRRDIDRSAYRPGVKREGFEALMEDVTSGAVDVVVTWKLDRLTRRLSDFERLWSLCERHRVGLASVTDPIDTTTPMGVAIVRLLLTFAGMESTIRGERLASRFREQAMQGKPARGGYRGFGHTRDQQAVIEHEAELLREAARRVIDGDSFTSIARDWEHRGVVGSRGTPWSSPGIRSTLLSARMVGDRSYRGDTVVRGCFPPILDRDTHELVRSIVDATPRRMRPTRSLLQGLVKCGRCGQTMTAASTSRHNPIYRCPRPPQGCQRISVTRHCIETLAVAFTRQTLERGQPSPPSPPPGPGELRPLRDINRAYFVTHDISRTEWYHLRDDLLGTSGARAAWWLHHPGIPTDLTPHQLASGWNTLDRSAQAALISAVIKEIVVHPHPGTDQRFQPDRLEFRLHDGTTHRPRNIYDLSPLDRALIKLGIEGDEAQRLLASADPKLIGNQKTHEPGSDRGVT